ncbi:LCP family protein [Streptomyces cavernae]|uniref:LCP family protein n=1 Tax=Streptomyces cavernae TaxID=2259034 RepID=UPI000FEC1F37|nr:LCP family protein [Streptomyces cavernae]
MDALGRGRADDIDPADQWVLNPNTGDYELRLQPSAPQSTVPRPRRTATVNRSVGTTVPPHIDPGAVPGPRRRRPLEEPPSRRKVRPEKSKGKKVLLWTGGAMAFVLVGVSGAGYLYYRHLNGNITSVSDDGAGTGGFSKDRAINILLIGTDKRTGAGNAGYGDSGSPGHADTTLVLHVSKDRSNATVLSIPRDLITDIPDCPTTQEDGSQKVITGERTRFNNSLGQKGRTPSCTMRTVTELTGLKMDHFMVADFNAVKTLTTAVDGVTVCLAKDVNDPQSKLNLKAGNRKIEGETALAFVRTRKSFGNSGDLDRIKVQQQFLAALMRKLKSNDTLTSPTKLLDLAEAGTKALTVDSKISSINKLRALAMELGKLDTKNLSFTTVPVADNPAEKVKVTVVLQEPQAQQLFSTIKGDVSLTEVKQQQKKKEKAAVAARLKGSRSAASDVRVNIYNGGAPGGSAQETLNFLQIEQGVTKSSQLGNADETLAKTTLEYSPDQAPQARKLADIMGLPASALKPGQSEQSAQGLPAMILTLGEDYQGAGVSLSAPTTAPEGIEKATADKAVCAK